MLTAITGINWGDEGKGRMVDLISEDYDIVCRYQGGNNAGHTVINEKGKFILNLLPSGILRGDVVNIMGNGMVIDLEHLYGEMGRLKEAGIAISPENLKISDRAVVCMPYHPMLDILEEDRLGDAKFGSTRRGIGPVYGDKYMKKALRMGDLLFPEQLEKRLRGILEWKNLTVAGVYKAEAVSLSDMLSWIEKYFTPIKDHVCDTGLYLDDAAKTGKKILFEAQLGALRDIDFGIYPYTSSSSTISAYAPIGAGVPGHKIDKTIGVLKAYSSCVGEGPFTCEMFGDEAEALRAAGGEYGAATGRPRRVGPFDLVASKYGVRIQGADELALTKMDVLSYLEEIPICVAYKIDGVIVDEFPVGEPLNRAEPVIKYVKGWNCDISGCRKPEELPGEVMSYIRYIQRAMFCKVKYLSVGPSREQYVTMF